jgi:GNAT superfamily N-acetyltransferase
MALVLDRATADDAPTIARLWALGFSDPFNSVRYGSMTLDDKIALFTRLVLTYLEDEEALWYVMRDSDANGRVAAFASWRFPKKEQNGDEDQEEEVDEEQRQQKRKSTEEGLRVKYQPFTEKVNIPLIAEANEMWARLRKNTLRGRPAFG